MDIAKTIEHILQIQARAEARMDRTDRQLEAIRKLLHSGMKLVVRIGEAQKAADYKINALIDAQQRTDRRLDRLAEAQQKTDHRLDRLIEAMLKRGGDGRR